MLTMDSTTAAVGRFTRVNGNLASDKSSVADFVVKA